jgi:hypothetical protein
MVATKFNAPSLSLITKINTITCRPRTRHALFFFRKIHNFFFKSSFKKISMWIWSHLFTPIFDLLILHKAAKGGRKHYNSRDRHAFILKLEEFQAFLSDFLLKMASIFLETHIFFNGKVEKNCLFLLEFRKILQNSRPEIISKVDMKKQPIFPIWETSRTWWIMVCFSLLFLEK